MTVPLNRLYNFLDDLIDQDIIIYRWWPHGSKKLTDLTSLKNYNRISEFSDPIVVFHDQEPLCYFYQTDEEIIKAILDRKIKNDTRTDSLKKKIISNKLYLNYIQEITANCLNVHDNYILIHSEKNSAEIEKYINYGAIPVYYFSHALISRDWYRYAEIDPNLSKKKIQKDFLIYQRDWAGSREYRLKFYELLIESGLHKNSLATFNSTNHGVNYSDHQYKNNQFKIQRHDLENYFLQNVFCSEASADYVSDDYNQTRIEIILETIFDDQRWHLTEKTFRPIACGQPFILLSSPGSLKYLKSYGFKTFDSCIDESYDHIVDPLKRLQAVINVMQHIANMSVTEKLKLSTNLQKIANFNKKLFFNENFYKKIVNEYLTNIKFGLEKIKENKGRCIERWNLLRTQNHSELFLLEHEYQELLKKI